MMAEDGTALSNYSPPSFSGVILKRSAWLRSWNVRQASVHPASHYANGERGPALLAWHGGTQPGSIIFSRLSELVVAGDRLVLRDVKGELHFRASPGGPSIDDWLAGWKARAVIPRHISSELCHLARPTTRAFT